MTTVDYARSGPRRLLSGRFAWPTGFLVVGVLVLLFYYLIVAGYASDATRQWSQTWLPLDTLNQALIWAMCALGLNIVVGYAGLLDLGYVAFWAIGSYVAGWLASTFFHQVNINILGNPAPFITGGIHFNYAVVFVAGAAICALFGIIIGAPTLRLRSDYLAIVTLGFGEIIPQIFHNGDDLGGFNLSNGNKGITPVDHIKGPQISQTYGLRWWQDLASGDTNNLSKFVILAVLLALIVFISLRLRVGRLGRAWLAIREDELAAGAMGVPLMRTKLAAYAVGALAGGIAGVGYSIEIGGVLPDAFDFSKSVTLLAMVVLGGMGNVWGVMIGAIFLGWFNQTGLGQIGQTINDAAGTHINFQNFTFGLFGIVLVLMMLFRREGLIPEARTRLVLREPERTAMESLGSDMEEQAPELDEIREVTRDDLPEQREPALEADTPRGGTQ
ncbi:MAG: branched-chain amino acid ABC transporter permease [Micromonosporaceae bacterium]|nr:branched-chain amino acid ABC transporter permease [Micromonosporaceae bacterium]